MIEIVVTLVDARANGARSTIGRAQIVNDGSGSEELGNYQYCFWDHGDNVVAQGQAVGFPRTRLNVWNLIAGCLIQGSLEE